MLDGLTKEQIRNIAETETPKPETGEWTLISPTGNVFYGTSPLRCVMAESNARIPALVAMARIEVSLWDCEDKEPPVTTSPL